MCCTTPGLLVVCLLDQEGIIHDAFHIAPGGPGSIRFGGGHSQRDQGGANREK
jgi:hypothetical protein